MKVSPETWRQVKPLLDAAIAMQPSGRDAWLAGIDATHPDAAPLLRKMLDMHERAERSRELETVPRLAPAPPDWENLHGPGERVGPFELVRLLGRGGMGEVWLARQADGRIVRTVALKLPAIPEQSAVLRERFQRERDILARLEHPHIAHLYDAGVSDAGQPWLAMEFVEGHTLSEHVAAKALPIPARLALFRQVLEAVAHAHRHLVVHRDLKPANILVDASGQVKLLDFGIAKLVDGTSAGASAELTRLGGRVMTLRYAAPEQVAAGSITTATDIYSLGVILHELLTGLAPYRAVRDGKPLTDVVLLQEQPAIPSRLDLTAGAARERGLATPRHLARSLAGDLDSIVLKAMRRDPAQRYGTTELLDADIRAHLERRPVQARAGTWRYLAGRYALRHKLPLATAAAVLVTLLAGLVMAERERRVAVTERARAERHFDSVRKLANTFIFDVQSQLEPLAGSLDARRTLVRTALEYLDRLADESRGDPQLVLEVAGAYRRLAEITGDSRGAHLGDPAGARRLAGRAAAMLEAAQAGEPENIGMLRERRILALLLGRLRLESGDSGGVSETAKAVGIAEAITRRPGASPADRATLGATLAEYGGILAVVKDDHDDAAVQLARAVEILEAVVRENPRDTAARASLAYAYERSAMAAEVTGRPEQMPRAIELQERSIATLEAVVRDEPRRASYRQTLATRYNNAARAKLAVGDTEGARDMAAHARILAERLVAEDPRNVANASILAGVLAMASGIEHQAGRHESAVELARLAIAADARLPAETRAGLVVRENLNNARRALGASTCVSPATAALPPARRAAVVAQGRAALLESRAFKRELVERGIDARDATAAIAAIDLELGVCARRLQG